MELTTFLAVILGAVLGPILLRFSWAGVSGQLALWLFSLVGLLASFGISKVPASDSAERIRWNLFGDIGSQARIVLRIAHYT